MNWTDVIQIAKIKKQQELEIGSLIDRFILRHSSICESIAVIIGCRLGSEIEVSSDLITESFLKMVDEDSSIEDIFWSDLKSYLIHDPACSDPIDPLLFYKGYLALQSHRLSHWLWSCGKNSFAKWIQWRISCGTGIDIHPAAKIGSGVCIDHGTGIVIGETAEIGNGTVIFHNVTLGGTGKDAGLRHPVVEENVVLYAGSTSLGRVTIGRNSIVAAGSLVLKDVPAESTMVGIPARALDTPSRKNSLRNELKGSKNLESIGQQKFKEVVNTI